MEVVYTVGLIKDVNIFMTRSGMPIIKFNLLLNDGKIYCEYLLKDGFSYQFYNIFKSISEKNRRVFIRGFFRNTEDGKMKILVNNLVLLKDTEKQNDFLVMLVMNNHNRYFIKVEDDIIYIRKSFKKKDYKNNTYVNEYEDIKIPTDLNNIEKTLNKSILKNIKAIYLSGKIGSDIICLEEIGVAR